jgi:hypothetical protein
MLLMAETVNAGQLPVAKDVADNGCDESKGGFGGISLLQGP